jgi:hypothetical protein
LAENYPFNGANKVFSDPHGERKDLWTFFNGMTAFSRWKLSPEELEEINRTGEVCLAQMIGKNIPMPRPSSAPSATCASRRWRSSADPSPRFEMSA